jgi:hypothetical protein
MALVEVARLADRGAAAVLLSRLRADGIESLLFDDGLASAIGGLLSGIRVMVREEDATSARRLIDAR